VDNFAKPVYKRGLMGRPIARRLLAAGWSVTGWNRSILPAELIRGISICPHLKDAAAADVCLLMLKDSKATNSVLSRLEPYLSAGQIVLDMGSSDN
jgi:3-hydroxyisobutyrate dehydrogenase-like beta-hydroxyacid dehydrogenase